MRSSLHWFVIHLTVSFLCFKNYYNHHILFSYTLLFSRASISSMVSFRAPSSVMLCLLTVFSSLQKLPNCLTTELHQNQQQKLMPSIPDTKSWMALAKSHTLKSNHWMHSIKFLKTFKSENIIKCKILQRTYKHIWIFWSLCTQRQPNVPWCFSMPASSFAEESHSSQIHSKQNFTLNSKWWCMASRSDQGVKK